MSQDVETEDAQEKASLFLQSPQFAEMSPEAQEAFRALAEGSSTSE